MDGNKRGRKYLGWKVNLLSASIKLKKENIHPETALKKLAYEM